MVDEVDLSVDDAIFLQTVVMNGGVEPEIMATAPEVLEMLIPVLRKDFAALNGYQRQATPLVSLPMLAVHGAADEKVDVESMRGWHAFTTGRFVLQEIPGGHFLFTANPDGLMAVIEAFILASTSITQ